MDRLSASAKTCDQSTKTLNVEPRLPTLFGRLTSLLTEHEQHAATLEKLREMCEALESGRSALPSRLEPPRLIAELTRELKTHFAAEESDAHFPAIARQRPELLPRVVDLKTDHAGMLRALRRLELIAAVENRWHELPGPVRRLLTLLNAHEQAEAELVHQFISVDGGDARTPRLAPAGPESARSPND